MASAVSLAFVIILQRSEEVANDGDAPGTAQDFLPLHPAHVFDVGVVFGETEDPTSGKRPTIHQIGLDDKDLL